MSVRVVLTNEFQAWFLANDEETQDKLSMLIGMLEELGVVMPFPYSSKIFGARYNLRELRTDINDRAYRMLYVFDPKRNAVMLLGGDKSGVKRWYEKSIVKAEKIYEKYLETQED